jgi:hypothetical protein
VEADCGAGRGGRRLDKRWARDRGGGGDDLPPVTVRRISARGVAAAGSGGGSRRRQGRRVVRGRAEGRRRGAMGRYGRSAMLGEFVAEATSKSAPHHLYVASWVRST